MLKCCDRALKDVDMWFLKDIKGFTARHMFWAQCPLCKVFTVFLSEKRIEDGKVFIDEYKGYSAIKVINRERKRIVQSLPHFKSNNLPGWIYGKNVQVKNKKGKITKICQYAADFDTNKSRLVKTITVTN